MSWRNGELKALEALIIQLIFRNGSQKGGDGKMDALAGLNSQICQRQPQRTRRASEKAQDELTAVDRIWCLSAA